MSIKRTLFLFLMICLGVMTGSSGTSLSEQPSSVKIMTTIFPLKEFANAVSGDWGTVDLLLPPGAEIHAWQPRPSDLVKLSSADVFIYIGAELEPWVEDILRSVKNPGLHVVEVSDRLNLIRNDEGKDRKHHDHEHGSPDPHIWLDFANDEKIVDRIAVVLSKVAPSRQTQFQNNADIYKKKTPSSGR